MSYTASIEIAQGETIQHPFHLGTDRAMAKTIVEEIWRARREHGFPVISIGLLWHADGHRSLVDTFDGEWSSEYASALWDE